MTVRVRFAPSPTGDLHVGSARSALFNHLFARASGGKWVLRIEDTDEERNKQEAIRGILDGFEWLGLHADEGPVYQSDRKALYRARAEELLRNGGAYRCACTVEHLDARRKAADAAKRPYRYERTCRDKPIPEGVPTVLRARLPEDGDVVFKDRILGEIRTSNRELDDFVILRANGNAIYNFCVVVDDIDMRISHVIRGNDHVANTPKQIHLYRLLGAEPPEFAHIPMIHGTDGKKLSKRHGAVGVLAWRDLGFLPEAMLSYLARLGWSHGDQEEFTREELERLFTLDAVNASAAIFDPKKLEWVNARVIRRLTADDLAARLHPFIVARGWDPAAPWLAKAAKAMQERSVTLVQMADGLAPFYAAEVVFDLKAKGKFLTPEVLPRLAALADVVAAVEPFEAGPIGAAAEAWLASQGLELKQVGQAIRVALTGVTVSPPLWDTMEVLGRERTLARLRAAASGA
ncbi:MAG TPA: glutamate--tRNA ligase [Planctomycetota bacterium]|nr:glutamate--tRNA ligase [Planctomycetota bacterium]